MRQLRIFFSNSESLSDRVSWEKLLPYLYDMMTVGLEVKKKKNCCAA